MAALRISRRKIRAWADGTTSLNLLKLEHSSVCHTSYRPRMSQSAVSLDSLAAMAPAAHRHEVIAVVRASGIQCYIVINVLGGGDATGSGARPTQRLLGEHQQPEPTPVGVIAAS